MDERGEGPYIVILHPKHRGERMMMFRFEDPEERREFVQDALIIERNISPNRIQQYEELLPEEVA